MARKDLVIIKWNNRLMQVDFASSQTPCPIFHELLPLSHRTVSGVLAQLVQSACLTGMRSLVRFQYIPQFENQLVTKHAVISCFLRLIHDLSHFVYNKRHFNLIPHKAPPWIFSCLTVQFCQIITKNGYIMKNSIVQMKPEEGKLKYD